MHKHNNMQGRTPRRIHRVGGSVPSTFRWKNTFNRATGHEGETLHPPEIDGDTFTDGAVAFLVGKGVLICSRNQSLVLDFGGLFLWPCTNKQIQDQPR